MLGKSKVFALYLGSKVLFKHRVGKIVTLYGVPDSYRVWCVSLEEDEEGSELSCSVSIDKVQLILKELSEITDEDIKGVSEILFGGEEEADAINNVFAAFRSGEFLKRMFNEPLMCDNIIEIIDYLRSRSYALPYQGKCLFESGIAIKAK